MIQEDAGQDKMVRAHTPNMVTWESFGQEQRIIRKQYLQDDESIRICDVLVFTFRTERRNGKVPTFKEFVSYLVTHTGQNNNLNV